jgi:hypothetical protein
VRDRSCAIFGSWNREARPLRSKYRIEFENKAREPAGAVTFDEAVKIKS